MWQGSKFGNVISPVGAPGQSTAQMLATSTGFQGSGAGSRVGRSSMRGGPEATEMSYPAGGLRSA
eukprot:1138322-Alexandrium_andersonii.AAC.1